MNTRLVVVVSMLVGLFVVSSQSAFFQTDKGAAAADAGPASVYLGEIESVDLTDVRETFGEVFSRLPDAVTVYPSENYLYYRFRTDGREMWGNIRLSPDDRDQGTAHFAYYEFNPRPTGPDDFSLQYRAMGPADGVALAKRDSFRYEMTYEGRTVVMNLHQVNQAPPRLFEPAAGEVTVFRTYDESRFQFFLVFNEITKRFMYVLNEEETVPDTLLPAGRDVVVGQRSGFAFFVDRAHQGRKVLMGVAIDNIRQNNYYDGPFDQLADNYIDEDSRLSEFIQLAYPYTKGYVDRYGKFITMEGSRVAITPYASYSNLNELGEIVSWCRTNEPGLQFYSCVAYDDKTRFELPSEPASLKDRVEPMSPPDHAEARSKTWPPGHTPNPSNSWNNHEEARSKEWPAGHDFRYTNSWGIHYKPISDIWPPNHWVTNSKNWGPDHEAEVSRKWPANHYKASSEKWPGNHDPVRSRSWPANHEYSKSKTWPQGHEPKPSGTWPPGHGTYRSLSWPPNHGYEASRTWGDHDREVSKGWPAGHRQRVSVQWGADHDVTRSPTWPADHNLDRSKGWPATHRENPSRGWPPSHGEERSLSWPGGHHFDDSRTWENHNADVSKGWPGDHRAVRSSDWGQNHDTARSLRWPPNHDVDKSQQIP